jgi:pyruvate formate lyase activating enzyme
MSDSEYPGRWWHMLDDGRMQCDLCPRDCRLHEGQRGACFVRMRERDRMVLTTYGRSSGFCIDPVEKKPLNHFYPGTSILSFGTAGCNLACKFCQNWDISKSRDMDRLADQATPEGIAQAAVANGCRSVAFTYNDPVIFAEYAMDIADACRERGIKTVAVTAGYMHDAPRREFYAKMDAANVDLKAFTDDFYFKVCGARLKPVLDTLVYLRHETDVWFEITTLLIPGKNDSPQEIEAASKWIMKELGPDVPVHFTAFHPDYKMTDIPGTPAATLTRARSTTSTPATCTTPRAAPPTAPAAGRRSSCATGTTSRTAASGPTAAARIAMPRSRAASRLSAGRSGAGAYPSGWATPPEPVSVGKRRR